MEQRGTNMENIIVLDARQYSPLFVQCNNEYCAPYKCGGSITLPMWVAMFKVWFLLFVFDFYGVQRMMTILHLVLNLPFENQFFF